MHHYGFITPESSQAGYSNPWATFPLTLATGNRRVLLQFQSVVLAEQKLLFAVEHARLDQNDGVVG